MKPSFFWGFSLVLSFAVGCSNTTPQVSILDSLSGNLVLSTNMISTPTLDSVEITGSCPSYITQVEVSFNNTQQWQDVKSLDANALLCLGGKFKMTTSYTSFGLARNDEVAVRLRPSTALGTNAESIVRVRYAPIVMKSQEHLVGASSQTSVSYKLSGRVRMQNQKTISGGNYQITGWVRQ